MKTTKYFQYGVRLAVSWKWLIEVKMYALKVNQTSILVYYKPDRPYELTTLYTKLLTKS